MFTAYANGELGKGGSELKMIVKNWTGDLRLVKWNPVKIPTVGGSWEGEISINIDCDLSGHEAEWEKKNLEVKGDHEWNQLLVVFLFRFLKKKASSYCAVYSVYVQLCWCAQCRGACAVASHLQRAWSSSLGRVLWCLLCCKTKCLLLHVVGFRAQDEVELGCDKQSLESTEEGRISATFLHFRKVSNASCNSKRAVYLLFPSVPKLEVMFPAISEPMMWLKYHWLLLVYLNH